MGVGAPGVEQFRDAIIEFRNPFIITAMSPLMTMRGQIILSGEFKEQGGMTTTAQKYFCALLQNCDKWRRVVTYNPNREDLGGQIKIAIKTDDVKGTDVLLGQTAQQPLRKRPAVRRRRGDGPNSRCGSCPGRSTTATKTSHELEAQLPLERRHDPAGGGRPVDRRLDAARVAQPLEVHHRDGLDADLRQLRRDPRVPADLRRRRQPGRHRQRRAAHGRAARPGQRAEHAHRNGRASTGIVGTGFRTTGKDFNGSLAESLGLLDAALAAIAQTGDASHDLAGSHTREDLPKPISDPDAAKAPEATDKPLTLGDHI
jgi:hypothetical protein